MAVCIAVSATGEVIADRAEVARGAVRRARGLIGRRGWERGAGLVLVGARQIHTVGMRFPIDVVFCDADGVVLHVERRLRPFRITRWVRGGRFAVELPAGAVAPSLVPGDRLTVRAGPLS